MRKIALAALLAIPLTGSAQPDLLPSHIQGIVFAATIAPMVIEPLLWQATTTTEARSGLTAILTSDSGSESAPTAASGGLDLRSVKAVQVILKTSGTASTGTLQCYVMNAETETWARAASMDLTATATTHQTWPAINIPVGVGRIYFNPNGIGSVQTTVYLVGGR
jgi:hypothetical protein